MVDFQRLNSNQTGRLWDSLSSEEKDELLLSYEESFNRKNLISHEEVKGYHDKWLRKNLDKKLSSFPYQKGIRF